MSGLNERRAGVAVAVQVDRLIGQVRQAALECQGVLQIIQPQQGQGQAHQGADALDILCAVVEGGGIDAGGARFEKGDVEAALGEVRKTMMSGTRLFARLIRKQIRRGVVSSPYALEGEGDRDRVLEIACERLAGIRATTGDRLPREIVEKIYSEVSGLLPMERFIL